MNEYERVKQKIADCLWNCKYAFSYREVSLVEQADQILSIESLVVLADDQSLPRNPWSGYQKCLQDIADSGFRRIAEVPEEEDYHYILREGDS